MASRNFLDKTCMNNIYCPTHKRGNVIDLLLTNAPELITHMNIIYDSVELESDHYPIEFTLHGCKLQLESKKKNIESKITPLYSNNYFKQILNSDSAYSY